MKYTIHGFQQKAAFELGLNDRDLLYLRWFIDFKGTDKMVSKVIKGIHYFWVKYESIIEDFPCLEIKNKTTIARRFDKMCKSDVLVKYLKKDKQGTFTLFALGENYIKLIEHDKKVESKSPADDKNVKSKPFALDKNVDPKDTNTKYNPNRVDSSESTSKDEVDELIDYWNNKMHENLILQKKDRGPIYGIIKTQKLDRIKSAIDGAARAKKEKNIKYTFQSIVYKPSNIASLSSEKKIDEQYKDLSPEARELIEKY